MKVIDDKVSELDVPLPLWRKICFAIGGTPYQMTGTVIGFFLNIFLLEVALVSSLVYSYSQKLNAIS